MQASLTCSVCATTAGTYDSYEEWSDAAARLGWQVGEYDVICPDCL
jgi:hypothetical protein